MTNSILKRRIQTRARGFTIIELLVVSAISIVLMTVGAFIYSNCLKIYQEGLGVQSVFETSKFINRDLRTYLGNVVPIPGAYISTKAWRFPGVAKATSAQIDSYYFAPGGYARNLTISGDKNNDIYFSGAQAQPEVNNGWVRNGGDPNSTDTGSSWCSVLDFTGNSPTAWWMPGFFGQRDGSNVATLKAYDITAGSSGWPRADYRLDADADKLGAALYPSGGGAGGGGAGGGGVGGAGGGGGGPATPSPGKVISCWFYSEYRNYDSFVCKALDNANIMLVSIKFSMDVVKNREETQLSFLSHQICGFDGNGKKWQRADQTYGNMLRSIKIDPIYVDNAGTMQLMDDNALGCDLLGTPLAASTAGREIPRAFDIRYTLINPANQKRHRFSLRVYCQTNMQ
ncbi:MAG: prepilin-type N-terminal cleavage/methylation domain-containing protein [Planctomycetes bacterium]|nr:prepilin-type N-terminal cleavage/methylation domain-containing protein [Planctomycetota bacterium]